MGARRAATPAIAPRRHLPGAELLRFPLRRDQGLASTPSRQGETGRHGQVAGKANIVDVVNSVNAAELTLDTVVAVRDKVVAAYQSIMNMPI